MFCVEKVKQQLYDLLFFLWSVGSIRSHSYYSFISLKGNVTGRTLKQCIELAFLFEATCNVKI